MKKLIYLLLLLPSIMLGQAEFEKIAITEAVKGNDATRVIVQDSITKELKFVLKSSLQTNISIGNKNANTFQLLSSTGSGPTVPQATTTEAGLLNASDKTKLNGVATGATANSTDAQLRDRSTHTGTQLSSTISDIQSTITNNSNVLANTAKITNATHTGDATGSTALTLATVNDNLGTFNNVTVNAKGLVTSASNVAYASGSGSATGTNTGDNATNTQYSGLDSSKENTIESGTTGQYFRGDKTFQELNKAAVGLANAENTSDLNKPISTAAQTALNLKANLAGGNTLTGNQTALSGIIKVGDRPIATRAISFSASLNDFIIDNNVNGHSFEESSRLIAATNNASFGFYDNVPTVTSLGSISLGHLNGFQSRIRYEGAASFINDLSGGIRSFYSDIFIAGSGNVPYTAGLYIQNATVTGTGRVQNQYGIIIGNLDAGTISNRGIASYTYRNFLQGLSIGSDVLDTDNPLRVEGNGKFTGTVSASNGTLLAGTGTTNRLAKFTGSGAVGHSGVTELANGNLGINQPAPTEKLDVVGNGKFSGTVTIGGAFGVNSNPNPVTPGNDRFEINTGYNANFIQSYRIGGIKTELYISASRSIFDHSVTASPATLSTELATLGQVRPYKVYVALLTQTGTNAPVATILENTLGGTVVWSRIDVGVYRATLVGAFVSGKTTLFVTPTTIGTEAIISSINNAFMSPDNAQIAIYNTSGTQIDGSLSSASLEIRVYN